MKLDIRGRAKYKPDPTISKEKVLDVLLKRLEEERVKYKYEDLLPDFEKSEIDYKVDKTNIISLFSGAGGLDLGIELAGLDAEIGLKETNRILKSKETFLSNRDKGIFNTVYANDIFQEAIETYQINIGNNVFTHKKDIREINHFPHSEFILGGFPCPGFSEGGPRLLDDERNFLYIHFIRSLIQVRPKFFIAENVKGMLTLGKGEVFKQIVEDFSAAGYTVNHKLVNARDYGIPQMRERVFLVGVRKDIDFTYNFPRETHGDKKDQLPFVTLRDSIGDLLEEPGPYFKGSYSSIYMSRNRKKNWEEQSFTIQASGRQAPLHPSGLPMEKIGQDNWIFPDGEHNNRRLSVKEIARIQTFPDWYEFSSGHNQSISESGRLNKIYKQIGNAVPVELGRAIARPIASYLKNE